MVEQIVILDFGSQYTQVIARRIRECNVYSIILRYDTPAAEIVALQPKGIILSGGPSSVYAKNAPLPAGHLLWFATAGSLPGWEGRAGTEARIRQRHPSRQRQLLSAVRKPAGDAAGLEFPRR